ncbi:MAG: CHASE domain-containing protein [Methylomonas sp.]|nr:CHASE domain-containing protein [Methylomonas sp.]
MRDLSRLIGLNLIVAIGYFIGGWLGSLLATPPSNVSPIWPAAGVALAALLVRGTALLPGLFLGALVTQFYAFLDSATFDKILESLSIGLFAAIGSCLQAWAAMWAIERWVGKQDPLIDDRKILRFFVLIAASCLLSASIGSASLYAQGIISLSNMPSSWLTWWAGDTIGSAIFTPLLLLFVGKPKNSWLARRRMVLYPLSLVILLVLTAFKFSLHQEHQRISSVFERQVELLHITIERRLHDHVLSNQAMKRLFDSSDQVRQDEFERFAQSILDSDAAVLEWTPRVPADQRSLWETTHSVAIRQRDEFQGMVAASPKAEYFPVTYIVPGRGNERAFGFDISSNPDVAPVISAVIDSGMAMATGSVQLIQDDSGHSGTVIYAPIYRKNMPLATVTERRQAFLGFIASVFRLDKDVDAIFDWLGAKELQILLEIFDKDKLIYSNLPVDYHQNLRFGDFGKSLDIEFVERRWRLHFYPAAEFFHRQQSPMSAWLLLGGFLLCGLTCFGLLLLTGRTARVEELVATRTFDLLRSNEALNQEIAIRRRHEDELRVAATTFESHEAILVTDAAGTILRVNKAFTDITGYSAEEVIGRNPRLLSSGYHDQAFYKQMYQELAEGNQWKGEIWNRRKNGMVFPEMLTVTCVRDEHKRLTHYVAIFSDISAQKAAEQEIRNLAFFDSLTNLPNRRLLLDRLTQEIAASKRRAGFGALFFLDLDHFKNLNDSRGHQVGDELLIQVAQRLKSLIRHEDTAFRL